MNVKVKRGEGRLAAAAALLLALAACAAPPPPIPSTPPPPPFVPPPSVGPLGSGSLSGAVAFEGNNPVTLPVVVRVRGRTTVSDSEGMYVLTGLPEGKVRVVAEALGRDARYLDLQTVFLKSGEEAALDMRLKDARDVDRYCLECHPVMGKQSDSRQIVRDLHRSGFKPEKAMRTGGMLDARGYVTCESCHSPHEETGVAYFVRYPYENGDLCNRCH